MKLQFDPNLSFQLRAIDAVCDLFDGQQQNRSEYSVIDLGSLGGLFEGQTRTELGVGNRLLVDSERLQTNVRCVQTREAIEVDNMSVPLEGWDILDPVDSQVRHCPHFSIEMETGTGKTYVFLRTIFELSWRFGFNKFVIVVPSVATREGVLKNIEITAEHFRALYNNISFEHFVYDAKVASRLRQFAMSSALQMLIINIDAFRRNFSGTEEERKSNVIYRESDKLSGRQPIEFVQSTRPIVIIDEPQSVDATEKAQDAIKALNPLCTLRYSATHRKHYNLVFRLDPVRAFELRLVKQIVVGSAVAQDALNEPFVRVERIDYERGIKAKLRIHSQTRNGPKERSISVRQGQDLFTRSRELAVYKDGFEIAEINAEPGNEYLRFTNGRTLRLGEEIGALREDIWRVQIKHTVRRHLEKELQVHARGIKVLSLFFVDRVANYRDYNPDGNPVPGKFAEAIERALAELATDTRYECLTWLKTSVTQLHNGYFARDRRGMLKDTRGDTAADDEVYNLIMKDKERLLSVDEPLRFIFSHSALREGWDNPNVFQICTLNESRSPMKKRQEIGRGLRLPVDQNGARIFDDSINRLYVMANESYEDFARALQSEYESDCGVTFGIVPASAFHRIARIVDGEERPIGEVAAEAIRTALIEQGLIDARGRIQPSFDPRRSGFRLVLPDAQQDLGSAVIDLLSAFQLERHVRRERDQGPNQLRKEVVLTPEFQALWARIKPKTTYRVEFESESLVRRTTQAIRTMEAVDTPRIRLATGHLQIEHSGVRAHLLHVAEEKPRSGRLPLPDILEYLQNETQLTRSTLVRILRESGRLSDVFVNPQQFLDRVTRILRHELSRFVVDGVKYERLDGTSTESEWEMLLFKDEELINYLQALQVNKSVYPYVVYDSNVEREFAESLDAREDIKLFVKLPDWFKVDTPIGTYNPDWAIVKHDRQTLYLVRETKDTRDFLRLRTSEADKVRCGTKHFEALGVSFSVVVSAEEV